MPRSDTLARLALGMILAGFLAGCQTTDNSMSWDYGKSFHTVFNNQKIDPNAGDDTPIASMDGTRTALAYERLEKAAPPEKKDTGGFEAFVQKK
ncbi:MAG: hypothetical protein ACLGQH_00040 [Acidobacteriota bacterium]